MMLSDDVMDGVAFVWFTWNCMFRAAIDVDVDVDVGDVDDVDGFLGGGAMLSYSQLCMLTIVLLFRWNTS